MVPDAPVRKHTLVSVCADMVDGGCDCVLVSAGTMGFILVLGINSHLKMSPELMHN